MKQSILVVDDEELILELTHAILIQDYNVTTASNATAAIGLLKSRKFDLIISDIDMPQIGGFELYDMVRDSGDDIPFVFITGYDLADDQVSKNAIESMKILKKPFRRHQLLDSVSGALSQGE
jgi:DNA-binding NtrC family response regulator